ncbi:hypothetical protein B0H10DRAFT_1943236 [Mycena sp. CBHHK59/15]|nr:hypothetical protein B0H10DRAFT_1943236 [Mycena sp. CBHHK59/15]
MAKPPVASAEHEPITSNATGTPQQPIWKKREGFGQELFDYIQTELYPEYVAWMQLPKAEKGKLNHKQWICATMWPKVDEKYKISGENGYNIADFLEVRHLLLPTAHGTQEPTKIKKSTKPVHQVAKEYGGEKSETSMDGLYLTHFNETATQMFAAIDATMKAQMETKAAAHNQKIVEGPTAADIAQNQGMIESLVTSTLHPLIGHEYFGQCGDTVFAVRGAYTGADRKIQHFTVSIVKDMASSKLFKDPSKQTEIKFKKWAMAELSLSLPDVDVATLSADQIRQILRKISWHLSDLANAAGTKITIAVSNNESEAQDIDEANLEDLRHFYTSALHAQMEGKQDFSPPLVKYSAVVAAAATGVVAAHGSPLPIVIPDREQGSSGSQCSEHDEGGADAEDNQVSAGGPGGEGEGSRSGHGCPKGGTNKGKKSKVASAKGAKKQQGSSQNSFDGPKQKKQKHVPETVANAPRMTQLKVLPPITVLPL